METLTINGLSILEIGFNENSGYTYIALENGVTICSMLGSDIEYVEYMVKDYNSGKEFFFNTFEEAEKHLEYAW